MKRRATPYDRATQPDDIKSLKFLWKIDPSMGWTDADFRLKVITYLDDFLETHAWAEAWEVVESFAMERVGDINVKTKRTPQLLDPGKPFLQRNADPKLVIKFKQGHLWHELGHLFPEGVATDDQQLDFILRVNTGHFEAVV